jgi:microcystin-dependent protein
MSEIRIMSFGFAPKGWAECNGQLMPINQNQALFSLLGTMFGGDGRLNFALPELRGRVPIHIGAGFTEGQAAGEINHTLASNEMPAHTHTLSAATVDGDIPTPVGNFAARQVNLIYSPPPSNTQLADGTVGQTGGSQAHVNMQPYLVLNYCIALQGVFPSRN